MVNPQRLHSDLTRLQRETDSFLATVRSLTPEELAKPSLCDGWDRLHVVAHVASNGRALVRLVDWATQGRAQQPYDSPQDRERDIEKYAALPVPELIEAFAQSARYFAEQCERLTGEIAVAELDLHGKPVPAGSIPAVRVTEIVLHHHDLLTTWTLEDAEPESLLNTLESAVRTMRAKGAPGLTLRTREHDEWIIGDGGQLVTGDRAGLLLWLARGQGEHVVSEGPLPELPAW